jgi:hypothetical protein
MQVLLENLWGTDVVLDGIIIYTTVVERIKSVVGIYDEHDMTTENVLIIRMMLCPLVNRCQSCEGWQHI